MGIKRLSAETYFALRAPSPTDEDMKVYRKFLRKLLYSNPFWTDDRDVLNDELGKDLVHSLSALPQKSRSSSLFMLLFLVWAHTMIIAAFSSWLDVNDHSYFLAWVLGVLFVVYDTIWIFLRIAWWRVTRFLRLKIDLDLQKFQNRSRSDYRKWLRSLKDENFSTYVEIQKWHQQEELLAEARKQTAALNSAAASAAITAFNTSVVKRN